MKIFIILFNLFILAMAGFMAFRPRQFIDSLLRVSDQFWVHVLAVVARITIGAALVLYADQSRFPLALQILGWVAIVAGIALALVPRSKFIRLMRWAFERFSHYARVAALFAVAFAVFLIYAVI